MLTSHSGCKCWSSVPVCGAGSHLGTQSSVTLTPLSRALKRRDGNWSSLVMGVGFLLWSQLSTFPKQISKQDQPRHRAGSWCHRFNPLTPSSSHSTPAGCQGLSQVLLIMFWKLQNNRESLHSTGFPLPGEGMSPMWRNPLFTGHPTGRLANRDSSNLTRATDHFSINGSMYRKTQPNK